MANLFISHSWSYGNQYQRLTELLANRGYVYRDYSVPSTKPILFSTDKELASRIESKIMMSSVVIIMAGVYSTYSTWINKEIELAKKWNKPINCCRTLRRRTYFDCSKKCCRYSVWLEYLIYC